MQERFDKEIIEIESYIKTNNLNAQKTVEGIYYVIDEPGGAEKPVITSVLTVAYTGKFLDGVVFDSSQNSSFALYQVIQGWQIGIPKFGKGGKGKLIIPSKFAYGDSERVGRANAILYFDIELKDFK
jgi:FKBP-type peptidyl-prolyl cis-trans isomerase FkpA